MAGNSIIELNEDRQLLLMAAQGDKAASGKLYRKYFPFVTGYIVKIGGRYVSPGDLAQEVFVCV